MSKTEHWDAIVIGSGIGGLSAAAGFAKAGKRVLILERLSNFGGAATVYRHGSLTMEASLHEIDGSHVFAPNSAFARLGLIGDVKPIETEHFYDVRGGPLSAPILLPNGFDATEETLLAALPASRKALKKYLRDLRQLHRAFHGLEDMASHGLAGIGSFLLSGGILELLSDLRQTLGTRLDHAFGDDEAAKCALGAMLGYFDDDPAKLSYLVYGGIWGRYLESGGYYFDGGSRALTMALLHRVTEADGKARRKCTVNEIILADDGSAKGVRYTDSNGAVGEAYAPVVFANAAPALLAEMLPQDRKADFLKPYASFEPSVSLFNVSLGLSRPASDFGINAFTTFVFPQDMTRFAQMPDMAARFGGPAGKAIPNYTIADYGRLDAGIRKPDDPWLVSICGIDKLDWWQERDETTAKVDLQTWIKALIADVDRMFPGFAGAVTTSEIATSRTMRSRLGTPNGEVYGFRPTPSRLFSRPPSAATSIKGLYLSSAYSISGGYAGAMQGGLMASDAAARRS